MEHVLDVRHLRAGFDTEDGFVEVLDGIAFQVPRGQTVGLVGESGCGKSVTALAIMGLLPKPSGRVIDSHIAFDQQELTGLDSSAMSDLRGRRMSMIFQEPMTSLNPVQRVGQQLDEILRRHQRDLNEPARRQRVIALLDEVGIAAAAQRLRDYPHQLSGGMRQRVMIAMALLMEPDLLIADEPTTALDVTVQAQILRLIRRLQLKRGMSVILITHDLGVVAENCDQVIVMYAGRIVEQAPVDVLFRAPRHPYTRGLLACIPRLAGVPKTPLPTIAGTVPTLADMPKGCRFSNRCEFVTDRCRSESPVLEASAEAAHVACHHWRDMPGPTS